MYRITTYFELYGAWMLDKKYLYDNQATFLKQQKYHKEKWKIGTHRVVSEENQNGKWVVIDDWILT